jgi:hypothetical protein
MRTLGIVVSGIVGLVIGCGSSTGSSSGNTDGGGTDGGGSGNDAQTSDGGTSNDCPVSPPNAGDPCALAKGKDCTYGTCGIVTTATCEGGSWSISKAGVNCAADAGPADAGVACGDRNDAGEEQPGNCDNGQTCCSGGAVGTYYCTFTDGGACPQVP